MSCPNCGSDDWKLARLVYEEGIQHIDTKNTSLGVGVGMGGVGIGIGGGKQNGIHQTMVSENAAPPSGPIQTYGLWGALIGIAIGIIIIFAVGFLQGAFFMLLLTPAGALLGWIIALFVDKTEYNAQMERWSRTKMCLRCGGFYLD